jgi:hypothetical protein
MPIMNKIILYFGFVVLIALNSSCSSQTRPRSDDVQDNAKVVRLEHQGADKMNKWCASHEGEEVDLWLEEMISLPGNTIILGGQYHYAPRTLHPTLLISQDGGLTWKEPDWVWQFEGCGILNLRKFGSTHIWGLVTYLVEGCSIPENLIRSTDGGKTWDVVSLGFFKQLNPLEWTGEFRFYDERHGLLTIDGSTGILRTYTTTDGGLMWKELWNMNTDRKILEGGYSYPEAKLPEPINAALWHKQMDSYEVSGVIRARQTEREYLVEVYEYAKKIWTLQSQIPAKYIVRKNGLVLRGKK